MTDTTWRKLTRTLGAATALAFAAACGGATTGGIENGDAGGDGGGNNTGTEAGGGVSPGQPGPGGPGPGGPGPGGSDCPAGWAHPNECCAGGGCRSSTVSPFTTCKPGETSVTTSSACCEVGVANPACAGSGGGGDGDGGTPTIDASFPPPPDDGGIGPSPRGCFSSGTSCQCEEMQNGHDYLVWCDNTSCVCSLDGNTTQTLASSHVCSGGPGALDAAWSGCGFPL